MEHLQRFADVGQRTADQAPFLKALFEAGHLKQRNQGAFDLPALGMALQLLLEGLERAAAEAGGIGAQRYLEMVPERVVLGTAPTTVSTF